MFRGLLDKAPIAILVSQVSDGEVLYANRKLADMVGLRLDQLIGRKTPDFYNDPTDRTRVLDALRAHGRVEGFELHVKRADGTSFWVESSFEAITYKSEHAILAGYIDITERKRAKEAVRASEARLANAQRIAHIGNWDWDIVAGELHWSDEIYRIFGFEPQEFGATYEAFLATIHPDDRAKVEQAVTAALEEDTPYSIEHRIVLPSGEVRSVHERAEVERDQDGAPVAMSGTVQDITKRRRAEDAMVRSRAGLADAQRMAHLGNWEMDIETEKATWSDELYRIFGYQPGTVEPTRNFVLTAVHPDDRDDFIEQTKRTRQGDVDSYTNDYRIIRPDGFERFIHSKAEIMRNEAGKPAKLIGTVQDITERKQAENALRDSGARIRGILGNVADSVITMTEDGLIESVNPAVEEMFGYAASEMVGNPITMLMVGGDRKNHDGYVRHYLQGGKSGILGVGPRELTARRKDGSTFPISLAIGEMQTGNQRLFIGSARDVTERKRSEATLRETLLQAEAANRSKSEFLANMSHELRTPLNAIIGFSQVLQDELKGPLGDPSYRQYVRDIHESGTLLLSLIQDILDLSKIEAGKLELRETKQSVPAIVGACRRIIEDRAKEAGLVLETRLNGGLPCLQVDERALKQIILNLLSNAVKFTPEGGCIAVDARVENDGCFAISISDTGIGIAAENIPKALSAFSQVENYLTREQPGTGLGLPLVKSLVEAHAGTLGLESELGRGTTATVRFPAERVIASSPATARNREAGAA